MSPSERMAIKTEVVFRINPPPPPKSIRKKTVYNNIDNINYLINNSNNIQVVIKLIILQITST